MSRSCGINVERGSARSTHSVRLRVGQRQDRAQLGASSKHGTRRQIWTISSRWFTRLHAWAGCRVRSLWVMTLRRIFSTPSPCVVPRREQRHLRVNLRKR
eukprot:3222155-Pleurochrysis_carterae.AAC.1